MPNREERRQYYLKHRERICEVSNKSSRKRRAIPGVRDMEKKKNRERYKLFPEKNILGNARARARKKNVEFNLCLEDIVIPEFCPYLEIRLRVGSYSERNSGFSPSIDRIDSSKGYTKENIEIISDLANRMKNNATPEQLLVFARNVIRKFG
jgi:hypothetical protein